MLAVVEFVFDAITRPAGAVVPRIAGLDADIGLNTKECQAIVEPAAGEGDEVVDRVRRGIVPAGCSAGRCPDQGRR